MLTQPLFERSLWLMEIRARASPAERRLESRRAAAYSGMNQPTTIPTTQAAIAMVEAQPSHRSQPVIVNFPMIRGCASAVMSIRMAITGTATTPLITAVQYRALMGFNGDLTANRALALQEFSGHPEGFGLVGLGVGDEAAAQTLGRAGSLGENGSELSCGTRLSGDDGRVFLRGKKAGYIDARPHIRQLDERSLATHGRTPSRHPRPCPPCPESGQIEVGAGGQDVGGSRPQCISRRAAHEVSKY